MKIRLMQSHKQVRHEFDTEKGPPHNSIIKRGDDYYVYYDAGDDEDGHWEEWILASVYEVNFSIGESFREALQDHGGD